MVILDNILNLLYKILILERDVLNSMPILPILAAFPFKPFFSMCSLRDRELSLGGENSEVDFKSNDCANLDSS